MTLPRVCAAFLSLREALVVVFLTVATFAFYPALPALGTTGIALSANAEGAPGAFDIVDDLGLDNGPAHSGSRALFSILYNASSHGEMRPCPT